MEVGSFLHVSEIEVNLSDEIIDLQLCPKLIESEAYFQRSFCVSKTFSELAQFEQAFCYPKIPFEQASLLAYSSWSEFNLIMKETTELIVSVIVRDFSEVVVDSVWELSLLL